MERSDAKAIGFLIRASAPEILFFRLFEEVKDERGRPCTRSHLSGEPMTARHFATEKEADEVRGEWGGPSAPGLGVVSASDPFGRASYRTFIDGKRVS